jgi:hypothetical protein
MWDENDRVMHMLISRVEPLPEWEGALEGLDALKASQQAMDLDASLGGSLDDDEDDPADPESVDKGHESEEEGGYSCGPGANAPANPCHMYPPDLNGLQYGMCSGWHGTCEGFAVARAFVGAMGARDYIGALRNIHARSGVVLSLADGRAIVTCGSQAVGIVLLTKTDISGLTRAAAALGSAPPTVH